MKKNILFKAVSFALAMALTFSFPVANHKALAADGTIYEAEDATIEGTPSTGDTFVESKASANGGKSVGYFGTAGNKIIWNVEHEGGEVTLNFRIASGAFSFETFSNGPMQTVGSFKVLLNGTELSMDDIKLEPNESYDNWTDFYVAATLSAGSNKIELEVLPPAEGAFMATAPNVDFLQICAAGLKNAGTGAATVAAAKGPSKVYRADEAVCDGAIAYGDSYFEATTGPSGSAVAGYLSTGGSITWTVEGTGAAQTLVFSLCSGALDWTTWTNADMKLSENIAIEVNGSAVSFNDMTLPGTGESVWGPLSLVWSELCVPVTLNKGDNTVTLKVTGMSSPKIEALEVVEGTYTGKVDEVKIVEKEVIVEKIVKENKYINVPTAIVKTSAQNAKDVTLFACIICACLAVCYIVISYVRKAMMSEEDKKAVEKVKEARKALKDAFEASYKNISDAEEKEIARYEYKLKCREAMEEAYKNLDSLTYGEGKSRAKALDSAYKRHLPACICGIVVISLGLGLMIGMNYTGNVISESPAPVKANSALVVSAYDWGAGANKLVLTLPGEVKAGDVSGDMFKVSVTKQGFMAALGDTVADRTVVDAYISDAQGNKVSGKSKYVAIEMYVDPAKDETSPYHYDFMDTQRNTWADPYKHTVTLAAGKKLQIGKTVYSNLECTKQSKTICPELNEVTETVGTYDGIQLRYASYAPEKLTKDNKKNALIIWLHGMGEGGEDIRINTLGNRVTALWQDEVQKCFDGNGAYVLAPQSPTMWMDNGTGELSTGATSSIYEKALWQLITEYVDANPDIDKNRIIIGGCSNGGYMTMNMVLLHPDYFAAAYPCCEAYGDENITDAQISAIKNVPMWFTHAKNDTTVVPDGYTVATYNRLIAAGAKEIHFTFWDDVRDTSGTYKNEDGTAYSYMGHWSWIYALNNECKTDLDGSNVKLNGKDVTIWQWLAAQSK